MNGMFVGALLFVEMELQKVGKQFGSHFVHEAGGSGFRIISHIMICQAHNYNLPRSFLNRHLFIFYCRVWR